MGVFAKIAYFLLLLLTAGSLLQAQHHKPRISLRDSLDRALDFSDWILQAHGIIPVPVLITEPAVGFGGALAPVLIEPRHQPADYRRHKNMAHIPPDITALFGMYTANGSWAVGGGRSGTIVKPGIAYKAFGGYGSMNLKFYRDVKGNEVEIDVNIRSIPVFLRGMKQLGYSNWQAGVQYIFSKTTAELNSNPLLDSLFGHKEMDNISSIVGVLVEFDKRDNVFTPSKGTRFHLHANFSDNVLGSDFDYVALETYAYQYIPIGRKWVFGLRGDMQQIIGDPPFYLLPSIDLRGIPKGRYQGKVNMLLETEQRWNMFHRWSTVFFGGVAKAFNEYSDFGSSDWVYAYGAGFRYLLARKLKLYVGADLARGPEQFGFYIQFGSAWPR